LQNAALAWIDDPSLSLLNHRMVREEIERAKSKFHGLHSMPDGRKWMTALRDFRDGNVGHSLIEWEPTLKPLFGDLTLLSLATAPIVKHLFLATEGTDVSFGDLRAEAERQAKAFWQPFFVS